MAEEFAEGESMSAGHALAAAASGGGFAGAAALDVLPLRAAAAAAPASWRKLASAAAVIFSLASAQLALSAEPAGADKGGAQHVGQLTYEKWCAPCHAPGPQHPGTQALDALYKGSKPGALIERTDLTPPVVKQFVRQGVSVMPFFRKTEISDAELDALAAFLSKQK
jgi:mono/diheme cytochrome c family protein